MTPAIRKFLATLALTLMTAVALCAEVAGGQGAPAADDLAVDRVVEDLMATPLSGDRAIQTLKTLNTHRAHEALIHIALGKVPGLMSGTERAAGQSFMELTPDKTYAAWLLATQSHYPGSYQGRATYLGILRPIGFELDEAKWERMLTMLDLNDPQSAEPPRSVYEIIPQGLTEEQDRQVADFLILVGLDFGDHMTAEKIETLVRLLAAYEKWDEARVVTPERPHSLLGSRYLQFMGVAMKFADPRANDLLRQEAEKWDSPLQDIIRAALARRGDIAQKARMLEIAQTTEDDLMRYIAVEGYCDLITTLEELEAIAAIAEEKPYLVPSQAPHPPVDYMTAVIDWARRRLTEGRSTAHEVEIHEKARQKREYQATPAQVSYQPFVLRRDAVRQERTADVASGKAPFQLRPLPADVAQTVTRTLRHVSNFKAEYGQKPLEERQGGDGGGGAAREQVEGIQTLLRGIITQFPDTEEAGLARRHLFDIHILHGDLAAARAECEAASREAPGTEAETLLWVRLGEAQKNRQDYAGAADSFARALDPVKKGRGYLRPLEEEFAGRFELPTRIEADNYVQARLGRIECLTRLGRSAEASAERADLATRYPQFKSRIDTTLQHLGM